MFLLSLVALIVSILRSVRIFHIAAFDVVATVYVAKKTADYLHNSEIANKNNSWEWFLGHSLLSWFMLGIFTHWVLGIPTYLNYYLGIGNAPY